MGQFLWIVSEGHIQNRTANIIVKRRILKFFSSMPCYFFKERYELGNIYIGKCALALGLQTFKGRIKKQVMALALRIHQKAVLFPAHSQPGSSGKAEFSFLPAPAALEAAAPQLCWSLAGRVRLCCSMGTVSPCAVTVTITWHCFSMARVPPG